MSICLILRELLCSSRKGSLDQINVQALIHTSCRSESSYLLGRLDNHLADKQHLYMANKSQKMVALGRGKQKE